MISLNNVRKQTLMLCVMENRFKVSRKEPKCHKLHKHLTKLLGQLDRCQNPQELEVKENF